MKFIEILFIGIGLSMDAFSLSISVSLLKKNDIKSIIKYGIIVGIFHFIMPLLGHLLRLQIDNILLIPPNIMFSLVIAFIIVGIIIDNENKVTNKILNPIVFSFSVSLDSFTIGISLSKSYLLLSCAIFSLLSLAFTVLGFIFGAKIKHKYKDKCKVISVIILLVTLAIHLLN